MKLTEIHLIKKEINALFHYPSFTLIEINDLVYDILSRLKNNESIKSIAADTNINQEDIENLITNLSNSMPDISNNKDDEVRNKRSIDRITLHVTNVCNLKCKYCYADGGNYKLPESMMTLETASKFIDFCTTHFDNIKTIAFFVFFPLLNVKVIEYICKTFEKLL
jgi:uncharacterized protein